MINFLVALLSGQNNKPSSTRFSMVVVVLSIMGVWTVVSIRKNELQKLEEWHVAVIAVAMGANVGTKLAQRPPATSGPNPHLPAKAP